MWTCILEDISNCGRLHGTQHKQTVIFNTQTQHLRIRLYCSFWIQIDQKAGIADWKRLPINLPLKGACLKLTHTQSAYSANSEHLEHSHVSARWATKRIPHHLRHCNVNVQAHNTTHNITKHKWTLRNILRAMWGNTNRVFNARRNRE